VAVGHGSEEVKTAFQITGFSISGRVVDAVGAGVAAAMVHVDGVHKATSDASGVYRLNSVRPGSYTLTATNVKGDVAFHPLRALPVKPNLAALPDIVASEVSVCGQVCHQPTLSVPILFGIPHSSVQFRTVLYVA
jgi:hypothetical protein